MVPFFNWEDWEGGDYEDCVMTPQKKGGKEG